MRNKRAAFPVFEADFPRAACPDSGGRERLREVMVKVDEPVRRRVLQDTRPSSI